MLSAGILVAFHIFMKIIVIANPFSMAAIFVGLVNEWPRDLQRQCARKASLLVVGILILTALLGNQLMHLLGISLSALEAGGGLCLLLTALSMFGHKKSTKKVSATEAGEIAVVPLGMPIIAGPAALAAVILFMRSGNTVNLGAGLFHLWGCIGIVAFGLVTAIALYCSMSLVRWLGEKIVSLITQITALVLVCMATQLILHGVGIHTM